MPRSRWNARCKDGVGSPKTLPQRSMQHPTPRDRPAACDPANHQSGRWVAAWTRGRQAMALCTASFTVNFAVQMQLITHCAGATSPRSSQATPAGPHTLWLSGAALVVVAQGCITRPRPRTPACVLRIPSGSRTARVAVLYHPPASVVLRGRQIRRSRNRASSIQNFNALRGVAFA